jgi:rhamnogalacturonan acetylesterase
MEKRFLIISALFILLCAYNYKQKPTLYITGDSTVRNGDGTGKNQQWGWGSLIAGYFDTTKINIRNHAIGGRSSRTFITEGRWDTILAHLQPGDYVLMQFGHNDTGPIDDTARARGTLKGIGDEIKEIDNPITKKHEVVHTYGWYMKRYVREAIGKGAIPIVCSPIPRNEWIEGKVKRSWDSTYSKWAQDVALEYKSAYIDLNSLIIAKYEEMGSSAVKPFFPADHVHTNLDGAKLNARVVIDALKTLKKGKLKKYMR